jgi:hypothetical protein
MSVPSEKVPLTAEKDLTPETRAILKRARRSFMISIGLLLLGFIAIGGALVYRATRDAPATTTFEADALQLPQGSEVISAIASAGTVTVTYKIGPATQVRIFDNTGKMIRQFDIVIQ